MKKTPEMRRREAKRKKRLEREKAWKEWRNSLYGVAIRGTVVGEKLKATIETIKKVNQQLARVKFAGKGGK